ncbi:MAG TPA: translation elongation factor Ts [Spirochaetia bacterium]|nr:translation elongation factor Ts [Spirochaetia bacterium]
MEVTASEVKKLREKTGAGMLDCKKALVEAGGDVAKAEKILKELGLAAAAKRSGRATNEGRIFAAAEASVAGLLELSCETDFVARNEDFITFGNSLLATITAKRLTEQNDEIHGQVAEIISRIKENIAVRRFRILPVGAGEVAVLYVHGEGSIGVIVKVKASDGKSADTPAVRAFAFDVALHIAAYNPMFLSKDNVDPAYLKEQEEIFTKQAENLGKPANVLAGIIKGKLSKHLAEICLLQQAFVKDDKMTVGQVQEKMSKEAGATITITDYLYYRVGEELS